MTTGRPGDGCDDPREIHAHRCRFCGDRLTFTALECRSLRVVPPCPRCGATVWHHGEQLGNLTDHSRIKYGRVSETHSERGHAMSGEAQDLPAENTESVEVAESTEAQQDDAADDVADVE